MGRLALKGHGVYPEAPEEVPGSLKFHIVEGDPSTKPPKPMFQLSGVHCSWVERTGSTRLRKTLNLDYGSGPTSPKGPSIIMVYT